MNQVLDQLRRKYVIETMRSWLEVPAGRPMSLYEVLWFAVSQGLTTHLPDALMAKMAGYKEPKPEPVLKLVISLIIGSGSVSLKGARIM
ncbi:hypothetical protein PCI56_24960 [Plesiomonas shigelloides subsp. oncorhynchi]|nr:hypothetical protein [Plesiomonas shigelloides]